MARRGDDLRPVLVGMCNPHRPEPRYALYPVIKGCSGYRVWKMLNERTGAYRIDYIRKFHRVNLCPQVWDRRAAEVKAEEIMTWAAGRTAVLFGEDVRRAFKFPKLLLQPVVFDGVCTIQLPHPSGRCLWYNDPANRDAAGRVLERLFRGEMEWPRPQVSTSS
jgi:hypothetical protein